MNGKRYHLVIPPQDDPPRELVQTIAGTVGATPYDIRLRMRSSIPRPVARLLDQAAAESAADAVAQFGVSVVMYEESRLPPVLPFEAHKLVRGGDRLKFTDRKEAVCEVATADVPLMIFGVRRSESFSIEMKTNTTYTSQGAMHTSQEAVKKKEVEAEHFIMLMRRNPLLPAIVIPMRRMDYACLGKHRTTSNQRNIILLGRALVQALTEAVVDERLLTHRGSGTDAYFNRRRATDATLADATLIQWQWLAERTDGRRLTIV
jgi:hypothetical protein